MSRLEDLIQELCPNGVEYKRLGDCANILIGEFVHKNKQKEDGLYPVYNGGVSNTGFYDESNRPANRIIISARGANAGFVNRVFRPFWSGNSCYTIELVTRQIDWNFLYYFLKSYEKKLVGKQQIAGIPAISKKQMEGIQIPVPPLEVQREIVRILDNFTELIAELIAELTARKQQYEYYREKLVCPCDTKSHKLPYGWKETTLGAIGNLTRGKRFVKADSKGLSEGTPCIHYGELYTYYGISATSTKSFINPKTAEKLRFAKNGDVIIVGAGENNTDIGVGVAWLGKEDVVVHDACYIYEHNENPKFISYYLRTNFYHNQLKRHVSEGKICSVSAEDIGKSVIYLPPIGIQNKIVQILDNFNSVCTDLISGLPAEINARQKQYKYYMDRLLTFKEKVA